MIVYPQMDPIAIHLGPVSVHWYGLMYLIGFIAFWCVLALRIKQSIKPHCIAIEDLSDILFYGALGIIIGGRLGYMFFYDWSMLIAHPLSLFEIWKGGMSFHGGLLGVLVAMYLYSIKRKQPFLEITDFITPAIPLGLATGRIGNFINGELWGRISDVPWAMIFPNAGDLPRHPSQLYEFLLEGIFLFAILWIFSKKSRPRGAVSGLFLLGYGMIRFCIEFYREPDIQLGFMAFGWLTQGQLLCLPMIIAGLGLIFWAYRKESKFATIS